MSTNRQIRKQTQQELATRKFFEKYGFNEKAKKDITDHTNKFFEKIPVNQSIDLKEIGSLENKIK